MKAFLVLASGEGVTAKVINEALAGHVSEPVAAVAVPCYGVRSNFADVQAFHDKFGLDAERPDAPRELPAELARYRLGFLVEELAEYAAASGATVLAAQLDALAVSARSAAITGPDADGQLVSAFDALLDLVVVALGTADLHGFPWEAGWDLVLARNLAKVRAAADGSDSKRSSKFDIVKPPGWFGPEAQLQKLLNGEAT